MKNSYHYRFTCKLRKNGKKIASLKLNMRILHYLLNSSDFISYLISQTEIVKIHHQIFKAMLNSHSSLSQTSYFLKKAI